MLPGLFMLTACSVAPIAPTEVRYEKCTVPREWLEVIPAPEPPEFPVKNETMLMWVKKLELALEACNDDKSDIAKKVLKNVN
jgi:hypothetical protein